MRVPLATAVILAFLQGTVAWADQVTLTNGDRLTGRIVELDAESLLFQSELPGEVRIPRGVIVSLASEQEVAVTLPDEKVVVGTLASRDGQVDVRTKAGEVPVGLEDLQAVRSLEGQAKYERSLHPHWYQNWELGVDTAFSTRGGEGKTRLTLGVDLARRTLDDQLTVSVLTLRETEDRGAVVNDNKARARIAYLHRLTKKTYYFGMGDFDRDALQELRLRAVLGGGLGWRIKETQRLTFDLIGGGALNSEYFTDQDVRRSSELVVGEQLRWQIGPRTHFEQLVILYPNLSRSGEYRVQLTSLFDTRINTWLTWRLTVDNHYLSNPPPGTDNNDLLITSGLRVNIGRTPKNMLDLGEKRKLRLRK